MFTPEAIKALQEAQSIAQAGKEVQDALTMPALGGVLTLPSDFKQHDLEAFMPLRRRARGTMTTTDHQAFTAYTKAHAEDGCTVFVNAEQMSATAVLNLGTPTKPGHTDNRAKLELEATAAFCAMCDATKRTLTQREAAEFFEDWPHRLKFFEDTTESKPVERAQAISVIRNLTIEGLRKIESQTAQLSESRSTFENVTAKAEKAIPTIIYFACQPYHGLTERTFVLRLGIQTGDKAPGISLRIVKLEQHKEDMANELADKVRDGFGDIPVHVGSYSKSP
jgi:uncharacterized protein YfdQ (DUF2303 family)